jgi:hypothetical protein
MKDISFGFVGEGCRKWVLHFGWWDEKRVALVGCLPLFVFLYSLVLLAAEASSLCSIECYTVSAPLVGGGAADAT